MEFDGIWWSSFPHFTCRTAEFLLILLFCSHTFLEFSGRLLHWDESTGLCQEAARAEQRVEDGTLEASLAAQQGWQWCFFSVSMAWLRVVFGDNHPTIVGNSAAGGLSLSLCPCSDIWFGSISFADILVDSQMDLPLLYIGAASIRRLQYGSKPLKDNDLPIFEWGNNLRMNIHLPTILILNAGDHGSCWHFPHWTDPCPAEVHGADLDLRT